MLYFSYNERHMSSNISSGDTKSFGVLNITRHQLADFCQRWMVSELALFGSALRDDFRPESDVDILVSFAPGAEWSLLDHLRMQEELSELLGRKVDLVSKRAIERSGNWVRRSAILQSAQVLYGA